MTADLAPLVLGVQPLPEALLRSMAFRVLLAFVSANGVGYAALAILRLLPPLRRDRRQRKERRTEPRSIYPDSIARDRVAPGGVAPDGHR
ncbi:hypothetical protein JCM18899A_03170 [Nocardioides sp. AN3]